MSLATEDALAALQNSNSELQTQLDDLNALMKRLHVTGLREFFPNLDESNQLS